ncbi:MAG: class I SAM-dependent methyltransferase [Planctomycetota bacterium]
MAARTPTFGLDSIARSFVDAEQDRAIKRGYLRWFKGAMRVLDVGCGTGTLLEELRDVGVDALGVDASAGAVENCRARGLVAEQADALAWMTHRLTGTGTFDGIALVHVIEHLDPETARSVIECAARLLGKDGTLLVVTPNFRNQIVAEEVFWLDPTHRRPYPRLLVERLCIAQGLRVIASFDDPLSRPRRPWLRRVLARLRSALSGIDRHGGMDSIVVAVADAEPPA